MPRAIRYYIILVIGREGKWQSPLMASGDFRGIKANIEGYETQFIEFEIWDKNDGPIPGIKLFKDFNIYLEREYCEY